MIRINHPDSDRTIAHTAKQNLRIGNRILISQLCPFIHGTVQEINSSIFFAKSAKDQGASTVNKWSNQLMLKQFVGP